MQKEISHLKKIGIPHLIVLAVVTWSCSSDDVTPLRNLTSYQITYMMGIDGPIQPEPGNGQIVSVEYDTEGRPTRRTGALIPIPEVTGFAYTFTDLIYDVVTYSNNKVTIVKEDDSPDFELDENWKELSIQNGRITRVTNKRWQDQKIDTIDFYYDGNILLKTIQKTYRYSSGAGMYVSQATIEKEFTFANGNLEKIEGTEYGSEVSDGVLYHTVEVFSDYDQAPNPTKRLIIFDETFYRALSKNNFRKYTLERRTVDGDLADSMSRLWTFQYDEQGVPTFLP